MKWLRDKVTSGEMFARAVPKFFSSFALAYDRLGEVRWRRGEIGMPSVKTELVEMSSVYTKDDPKTWEMIKANGDGAIIGVGH